MLRVFNRHAHDLSEVIAKLFFGSGSGVTDVINISTLDSWIVAAVALFALFIAGIADRG